MVYERIGLALALSLATAAAASNHDARPALAAQAPAAPQLTLEASPRTLRLRWSAVAGARHYRLYAQRNAHAPLVLVSRPLPAATTEASLSLSAHLHSWDETRYVVAACNHAGCARSAPASAAEQRGRAVDVLTSPYEAHEPTGGARNQQFGGQAAVSGDGRTLAVADLWYYGGVEWPWYGSGAVYVYTLTEAGWTLEAKLEPPNARGYDYFGSDVALSFNGDTLAVGAQYEGYDAPSQDPGPGSVFVFKRSNGAWVQQAMLRSTQPRDGAAFGRAVELSARGDVLAVGAPYEAVDVDGASLANAGAAYVFKLHGHAWIAQAELRAPSPQSHDQFGLGVRLSKNGRTLAILAAEQNADTELEVGWPGRNNTIYIYAKAPGEWSLEAEFEGGADEPLFGGNGYAVEGQIEGFDVSADGRTLAIASPFAQAADGARGLVRIFRRSEDHWSAAGETLTPSLTDRRSFGLRLALSADGSVLAAFADRDDGAYGEPYVVVFARRAGAWTQRNALTSPGAPDASGFANALSLSWSGKRLVVGARALATSETSWGAALVY